jgi:hypothetical protein
MIGAMAETFHVFVDGAIEAGAAALRQLAEAMAERYGLPAAELEARLARGRFRVKANVDRETAATYLQDLEAIGARCVVVDAAADAARTSSPSLAPATAPSRPSSSSLPPATAPSRPAASSLPPATKPASAATSGSFQSGLAAAFTAGDATNLGALGGDGSAFALASLDGEDDARAQSSERFGPGVEAMPASIGPAVAPPSGPPVVKAAVASGAPLDLFAPPEAEADDGRMELAAEEEPRSRRAAKAASIPPLTQPAAPPPVAVTPRRVGLRGAFADARVRFAVGVAVAVLLGFVPAHLFATLRERAAYGAIDQVVVVRQAELDNYEAWQQLDPLREVQLAKKKSQRREIAIVALLVWAAAGGGIAYGWFRRVPWDRLVEA